MHLHASSNPLLSFHRSSLRSDPQNQTKLPLPSASARAVDSYRHLLGRLGPPADGYGGAGTRPRMLYVPSFLLPIACRPIFRLGYEQNWSVFKLFHQSHLQETGELRHGLAISTLPPNSEKLVRRRCTGRKRGQ